ncbi:hypothetical protein CR513_15938, partial [Mucuna pruriens]
MGSAKSYLSMFSDVLDGRTSPFTRLKNFELKKDRSSSSHVIPTNVKTYLFSGSPGFNFIGKEGAKQSN